MTKNKRAEPALLSGPQVARAFRVDPRTVIRWAEAGYLEARRSRSGKQWQFLAAAVWREVPAGTELFRPAEVARIFRVAADTVEDWANAGKLPVIFTPGGHRRYLAAPIRARLAGQPAASGSQKTGEPRPIPAVVALDPNPNRAIERGIQ